MKYRIEFEAEITLDSSQEARLAGQGPEWSELESGERWHALNEAIHQLLTGVLVDPAVTQLHTSTTALTEIDDLASGG